jgi:PPOX class probable F420-dependent enzyme
MGREELRRFLSEGTRTAKLATARADGRPHVAPIWFLLDGDDLVFTTWHETVKAHNLRRDGRVALCVDEEAPPYAFVVIEGVATLSHDPEERARWARLLAARYMGEELAEEYGRRNSVEGELLVRVSPTNIIARKDIAG